MCDWDAAVLDYMRDKTFDVRIDLIAHDMPDLIVMDPVCVGDWCPVMTLCSNWGWFTTPVLFASCGTLRDALVWVGDALHSDCLGSALEVEALANLYATLDTLHFDYEVWHVVGVDG